VNEDNDPNDGEEGLDGLESELSEGELLLDGLDRLLIDGELGELKEDSEGLDGEDGELRRLTLGELIELSETEGEDNLEGEAEGLPPMEEENSDTRGSATIEKEAMDPPAPE
jgi:hypothetical protein